MKTKNNEALNKIFLIMGIFSISMLIGGFELGYNYSSNINNATIEEKEMSTIKNITANDNTLYESLVPKLTITNTNNPVECFYTIENVTNADIYLENVKIRVYDQSNNEIYATKIRIYKTYAPTEKDKIIFQVPQLAKNIGSIDIEFE